MTFEFIRAVAPFITLTISFFVLIVAWVFRNEIGALRKKNEDLAREIKDLEKAMAKDKIYFMERYTTNATFMAGIGEIKAMISGVFDQMRSVSTQVNQMIGAVNERDKHGE